MNFYGVSFVIFNIFTVINVLASIVILLLIIKMKKYNGYMLMLASMTVAELLYDSSLFLFNFHSTMSYKLQIFLGIFAGTATSLWSLVFSFVLSYIIFSKKYIDIGLYFPIFSVIVLVLSIWDAISCLIYVNDMYTFPKLFLAFNIYRMSFLLINFIVLMYVFISLILTKKTEDGIEDGEKKMSPLFLLAKRLCVYPIVQLVSRIPITVYQMVYQQPLFKYELVHNHTNAQHILFIISVVLTPSAGLGNFISFLSVQAEAKSLLLRFFCINSKVTRPESMKRISVNSDTSNNQSSISAHSTSPNIINIHDSKLGSYYNSNDSSRDTNISYYDDHVIIQVSDMDRRSSSMSSSISSNFRSSVAPLESSNQHPREVSDYFGAFSITQRNLSKQQHNFDTAEIGPDGRVSFAFERSSELQAKKVLALNNLEANNTERISSTSPIKINYDLLDEEQLVRHISYQKSKQQNIGNNSPENSVENPIKFEFELSQSARQSTV